MDAPSPAPAPAAAAFLPDDLVVEILSWVPVKSLCRFKCVSRSWLALITNPTHRLAQVPSCFFFTRRNLHTVAPVSVPWNFVGSSPSPPPPHAHAGHVFDWSLSFLPSMSCWGMEMELLDSCNGLLLLRWSRSYGATATRSRSHDPPPPGFYVVCNPATGEWVSLPQPSTEPGCVDDYDYEESTAFIAALGFDPAISPHFHVFQLVEVPYFTERAVKEIDIYSSETGTWTLRKNGWGFVFVVCDGNTTFFNGFQHFVGNDGQVIALVDGKGEAWRTIKLPAPNVLYDQGFVGHSQGRLHCVSLVYEPDEAWVIHVLEDHGGEVWTLKHRVSKLHLFRPSVPPGGRLPSLIGAMAALHPTSCDYWIFFYDLHRRRLMSYDMNTGDVQVIYTLGVLGKYFYPSLLLYLPFWSRKSLLT